MADQDQKIEKKSEEFKPEKSGEIAGSGLEKMKEGLDDNNLEEISSPENNQEKKKELIESIQQKSASGNDDDDDSGDDHEDVKNHAKNISEIKDVEQQVDTLVKLAVQKDPYTAMKVARHLDENYVLDQVHDRLVEDETRQALIKKGLLKEF